MLGKTIFIGICVIIIIATSYYMQGASHEEAHIIISEDFGCQNITMHMFPTPYMTHYCTNLSNEEYDNMMFQHHMNEVVGYNVVPLQFIMIAILVVIMIVQIFQMVYLKELIYR